MDEFDRRMKDLDGIDADASWEAVTDHRPQDPDPTMGRRVLVVAVAFSLFLGTAGVLGWRLTRAAPADPLPPVAASPSSSDPCSPWSPPPMAPEAGTDAPLTSPLAGRMVVQTSDDGGGPFGRIVELEPGSGEVTDLTQRLGLPEDAWGLTWAPDGTHVAVVLSDGDLTRETQVVNASEMDGEIWVIGADGSDRVKLTDNESSDDIVNWSPDGSRLTFRSNRDGELSLYSMAADGSDVFRLTGEAMSGDSHSWSPDGSRLVFAQHIRSPREELDLECPWALGSQLLKHELAVVDADGSNLAPLTDDVLRYQDPVWSPDGSKIAFMVGGPDYDVGYDIGVMNADGSGMVRLTKGNDASAPVWSPDGSLIVFSRERPEGPDGAEDLYVMNANGSGMRLLADAEDLGVPQGSGIWATGWRP